jgi:hypothetical protein
MWKNRYVVLIILILAGLLPACGGGSSGGVGANAKGGKQNPPDASSAIISILKDDLILTDPYSGNDGIVFPGEVVFFELRIRNSGKSNGRVDITDVNISPQTSFQVTTLKVNGLPEPDFNDIPVTAGGVTLVTGTAMISPGIQTPVTLTVGPPVVVASTPPTDPETFIDPDQILGKASLQVQADGGSGSQGSEGVAHVRRPASVLLFPFYRVSGAPEGVIEDTIITVTNTNSDLTLNSSDLPMGTVDVKYYYIDSNGCQPFDRVERLTPNDTFSVMVSHHLPYPGTSEGWLYVVAQDPTTHQPVDFDYLIGHSTFFDANQASWFQINPIAFRGIPGDGLPTDVDQDGNADLNGIEYEMMADNQMFPRFIGRFDVPNPGHVSALLFINLTGGALFQSSTKFLIFNDNEQIWSSTHTFTCWERVALEDISGAFKNEFLLSSNHDPKESLNILGKPDVETGWFKVDGDAAWTGAKSIDEPALLCVLFEWYNNRLLVQPAFDNGVKQNNATLWPTSPMGDNED